MVLFLSSVKENFLIESFPDFPNMFLTLKLANTFYFSPLLVFILLKVKFIF